MKARFIQFIGRTAVAVAAVLCPLEAAGQTARAHYGTAQAAEARARLALESLPPPAAAAEQARVVDEVRSVISSYEALVRRYPSSGYSDNALFNAAALADALHERLGHVQDRQAALRLYRR